MQPSYEDVKAEGVRVETYGTLSEYPPLVFVPPSEAVRRSIADVGREIGIVADWLGREPVLVAHSMGGLASLVYASRNPVRALVLITPVMPKEYAGAEIPLPVDTRHARSSPAC
jgi:pimeloyl-ACP methyl ester carboxylesterase